MSPTSSRRRIGNLCNQLAQVSSAATATTTATEVELKAILAALGPDPLPAISKKMIYINDSKDLPPLAERGYVFSPGKGADLPLVQRILKLCPNSEDEAVGSMGVAADALHVVKGMLLHAAEALDESHNSLVKVFREKRFADSDARIDSAYAHMLLHRQEGASLSAEGVSAKYPDGVPGFSNAKYWIMNTETGGEKVRGKGFAGQPKSPHPLYPRVLEEVRRLASGKKDLEQMLEKPLSAGWDAAAFTSFCQQAYDKNDPETMEFLRQVYNKEWRLLLEYCAAKAGVQL